MRGEIIEFKDLTDSRELLEAKPPRFFIYFTYLLFVIIVITLIWAHFGRIDTYLRVQGLIRPEEQISVVVNPMSGILETVYIENGAKVSAGDILYVLEFDNIDFILEYYGIRVQEVNDEIRNLQRYRESVIMQENLFTPDEERFYVLVENYLTGLNLAISQFEHDSERIMNRRAGADLARERSTLAEERQRVLIWNLELYITSIDERANFFSYNQPEFYLRITQFIQEYDGLHRTIAEMRESYNLAVIGYEEAQRIEDSDSSREEELTEVF